MRAKRFQMFDEGPSVKVGTGHLPPAYPLNQIKTPLVLFEGTCDSLQDASLKHLPSLVGRHCVHGYEHLDFMWAADVNEKVWPQIVDYLNQLKSVTVRKRTQPLSPPPEISKDMLIEAFRDFLEHQQREQKGVKGSERDLEYHKTK